jgi:hypothetical protein
VNTATSDTNRRRRGWLALAVGVLALCFAAVRFLSRTDQPSLSELFPVTPDDASTDNVVRIDLDKPTKPCAAEHTGPECDWCAPGHVGWPTCQRLTDVLADTWALMDEHFAAARDDVDKSVGASLEVIHQTFRDARKSPAIEELAEDLSSPSPIQWFDTKEAARVRLQEAFEKILPSQAVLSAVRTADSSFRARCAATESRALVASGRNVETIPDMKYDDSDLVQAIESELEFAYLGLDGTERDDRNTVLRESTLDSIFSWAGGPISVVAQFVASSVLEYFWERPGRFDKDDARTAILNSLDLIERDLTEGGLTETRSLDGLARLCVSASRSDIAERACKDADEALLQPFRVGLRRYMQNHARTRLEKYREAVGNSLRSYLPDAGAES